MTISLTHSQNEVDALRYSLFNNYNTAGISALGGAGGLLSPSHNPASLGFFSGDKLISLSLGNNKASFETNYLNEKNTTEKPFDIAPFIQNIGYVSQLPFETDEWNRFNMSFSFNRKKDFNREMIISGYNSSSMSNMFLHNSQGFTPDELNQFSDYLAWYTYLIDTVEYSGSMYDTPIHSIGQNQRMDIHEDGYINEFDCAFSGAYNDFLFFGMSIGITEIQFSQHITYEENDFDPINEEELQPLDNFEYNQHLYVEGEGVNFKFGTFIKPTSFLRLGWAYHSKTYTSLEEVYETSMETNFLNGDHFEASSPINLFNYELNTPAKSIATIGLIGNYDKLRVLLTLDYETIDYGSSNLYSTYYSFSDENDNIADFYARTNNKKLGLSLMTKNMSLKGGYSVFGSPFQDNLNDGKREYISAGIGFKTGQYSFDISMIHSTKNEDYILYQDLTLNNPSQIAQTSNETNTIIATCNYKF